MLFSISVRECNPNAPPMPSALSHYLDGQHVCGGILPQTSLRTQVPLLLEVSFFFSLSFRLERLSALYSVSFPQNEADHNI